MTTAISRTIALGEPVIAQSGHKPREASRQMIRARLFALADQGALPEMVFTKALEVSNLSYPDDEIGGISGGLIWAALGWILASRSSGRINFVVKGLYWVGIALCLLVVGAALVSL